MSTQTIILIAIMMLMLAGVGYLIFKFIKSIIAKRAYEREELPDISTIDVEDEVLPDVEESSFSQLGANFSSEDESASEIYREIYQEDKPGRRSL